MIGDVSSVLVLLVDDPRRLDGLLLVFFPEVISHEARSYDKIDVGDDMIEDKGKCQGMSGISYLLLLCLARDICMTAAALA